MLSQIRKRAVSVTAGALLVSLFSVIFVQIFLRAVGLPLVWAEEYSSVAFIWLIFVGAALAAQRREHLDVDLLYNAVSRGRPMPNWDIAIIVFQFVFLSVFAVGLVQMSYQTWNNSMGAIKGFRYGWIYLGALVAVLIYMIFLVEQFRSAGKARKSKGAAL